MTTILLNHPLVLSITLFLLLTVTVEVGFRLARFTHVHDDEDRHAQIAISRDSLGILLSLLLGFTLAMALPHYDLRKQLVMEEANAIGTTGLRATLLEDPQKTEVRALLLRYVEAFITSLNDTIDLSEKRLAAFEKRIPPSIWLLLVLISMLTCLTFGYGQRSRFWMVAVISPLMVAIVMGLIADLDSPRSGFLREDVGSLNRLAQDLKSESSTLSSPQPVHR